MSGDLLTDDIDADELFAGVADHMDRLRETADELRAGTINAYHAANRIKRIANEISRPKDGRRMAKIVRPIVVRTWCDLCDMLRECEVVIRAGCKKVVMMMCKECNK